MYLRSPNDHLGLLGWVLNLSRSILVRDRGREDKQKSRRQPDHRGRHWHDIAKEPKEPQEARRAKNGFSHRTSRKSPALPTP